MNDLAGLWAAADSAQRKAITAASHEIDQRLKRDAPNEGESRSHGHRILFVRPLVVFFRVEADGQTASFLAIRLIRRRP